MFLVRSPWGTGGRPGLPSAPETLIQEPDVALKLPKLRLTPGASWGKNRSPTLWTPIDSCPRPTFQVR